MAILPVRVFPHPCLHTSSRAVKTNPAITSLIRDLIDTMRHYPRCVGLAASQVGSDASVAVVDVRQHPKAASSSGLLVLVNPQITTRDAWTMQREGCLSVPDFTGNVRRASKIYVEALDGRGEPWGQWVEGFEAIAVQHEVDHLAGKLFLDRLENARTGVFRRKQYWFPEQPS